MPRLPALLLAGSLIVGTFGCTPQLSAPPAKNSQRESTEALKSLRELAKERRKRATVAAYRLGRGDLVEITVLGEQEMNRKVRVSESGNVAVPLVGSVEAVGRTESDLAKEISDRLAREHLQEPQVDVFVVEYKSQQVAVTGAVAKPGLYSMTRDRYTILDMLSEAGGLTKDAGGFIEFVPAEKEGAAEVFERAEAGELETLKGESITMNLTELMRGSNRALLKLPVVPGDVIFVPEAGSFAIEGWVDKPGTYPLTRGMTVMSALSTGGGPLFPARLTAIELLRSDNGDDRPPTIATVDLKAIREGRATDVTLRAGDVVRVRPNPLLVPPWAVYSVLKELIRFGASVAV